MGDAYGPRWSRVEPVPRLQPSADHRYRGVCVTRAALPNWPAMMRRSIAAAYCDLSVAEFEREIADGRLPMPVKLGNSEHWSKAGLDQALEQLAGGADNDWRKKLGLYAA